MDQCLRFFFIGLSLYFIIKNEKRFVCLFEHIHSSFHEMKTKTLNRNLKHSFLHMNGKNVL